MGIVPAMILSIVIKGIAAILELCTQLFISNYLGVSDFGTYAFFVGLVEGGYFLFFSGSIKLNTFYLSTKLYSITSFRKKYLLFYVIPVTSIIFTISLVLGKFYVCIASIALLFYYLAFDKSSVFFARGEQLYALIGEYLLGRLVLLIGIIVCFKFNILSILVLLFLGIVQYLVIYIWFILFGTKIQDGQNQVRVSIHKLFNYQQSDIASSLISYTPTILQYISGGAFVTGFIGVISIIRKFIYFISGPTAKVFLPEFSKLYKENKVKLLQQTYLMIVKLQMLFISIMGTAIMGFPKLLLATFNRKLVPYTSLFLLTGICLLFIASLGPVIGILQMTGNEKKAMRNQWISIVMMLLSWIFLVKSKYFIVYGLCIQAVLEGIFEYVTICRWAQRLIISPLQFIKLWVPATIIIIIVNYFHLNNSLIVLILSVIIVGMASLIQVLRDNLIQQSLKRFINKIKL